MDSLYEMAWVHVKKGDFEKAKNATDILLLMEPGAATASDTRLLQGHLQLLLRGLRRRPPHRSP